MMALTEKLFLITFLQVSISQAQLQFLRLTVPALRGSCVVIPCTFSNREPPAAPEELSINWYLQKGPSLVYSSKSTDPVPPEYRGRTDFVGDLKSGNCSLRINHVRGEDAEDYYPWIHPLTSKIETYRVTVSDRPEEISLGELGEMTEGVPVTITCSAVHTCPSSPPTLTWDWKDRNVHNYPEDLSNGRWKVVSEMYYTPMAEDHGKPLQCTASYTETITSKRNITMAIQYPPKNTAVVIHGNATFREGDRVTLSCSAVGNPDVSNYSWYVGHDEKPSLGHGQELTVNSIAWNSGPYSCAATNAVGSGKSAPLNLTIEHAPKEIQVIVRPSPVEGTPLTLTCMVNSSNPTVTNYTWYKDDHLMHENSSELQWQEVTSEHSGLYHCMAHNNLGSSPSAPVNVSVHYSPKGTHIYTTKTNLQEREMMQLKCNTSSSNPAVDHYVWFKNGIQLQNRSEKDLIIENVMPDDSGDYQCEAHNTVGNSSSPQITIKVNVEWSTLPFKSFATLGVTIALLLLLLLALFIFFWTRRNKEEKTDQSHSIPKVPEEQVVYVTINHSKERRSQKRKVPSDDFVTYAAVRRDPDSDGAYAEVRKPRRTPKQEEEAIYATDLKFNRPTTNGSESRNVNDDFVEYAAVKR
ncbi:sialoadhesin-like isoform X2 [Lissotriton helveticus]